MHNYLSYTEADELCDGLIRQYIGQSAPVPMCVDIDGFVADFLKCPVLYKAFAESDADKIGFTGDGVTPLRIWKDGKPVSVVYPPNTIVLEAYLLRPAENRRRRFTLGHEAGHILAKHIDPESAACFHREMDGERTYTAEELKERYTLGEWQANTLSASLLMPRFVMWQALKRFNGGRRLPVYGESVFHPREKVILNKMADALCVSYTALVIRLRHLGMLKMHPISEYIQKELRLGGDPP